MRTVAPALAAALVLAGCSSGTSSPAVPPVQPTAGRSTASSPGTSGSTSAPPARLRITSLPWRLPRPLAREALARRSGSSVLVAGGLLAGDRTSASTYTVDLGSGSVSRLGDLRTPVHDTAGALLGGAELVVAGGGTSEQSVVQSRSGGAWRVVGRLPAPRSDLSSVRVGRRVYVVGGYDGTSVALGDVLASADGRRWLVAARLPVPVRYAAVVAYHGRIWVFGGERAGAMVGDVQVIDPRAGTARVVARLPVRLGHAVAVVLGGRVLVVGGRVSADRVTGRTWWFRPGRGFTPAGRLSGGLADSAVVRGDARTAYLVGGETPAFSDRVVRLTYR